ncbi:MAG: RNA methyltransferase [Acetobacteraceae bacterium]|nr:RNA methyltransferase [Acetobacteraceae bacterium]
MLAEAVRSETHIESLYVTRVAFETTPLVRDLDASGVPTYLIEGQSAAKLSDLETPSGIVAVAAQRLRGLGELTIGDGILLVLADVNDPGNAGTLVRSADAFGALGVVFGRAGVDPYHPKVVRAAMGAIFRVPLATAGPDELEAAAGADVRIVGLVPGALPLDAEAWASRTALVVGHERHGLGPWAAICDASLGIRMRAGSDSLNAATAGSIALYEALKNQR